MADVNIKGKFQDVEANYVFCTQFATINIALPDDGTARAATVRLINTGSKTQFGDPVFRIDVTT